MAKSFTVASGTGTLDKGGIALGQYAWIAEVRPGYEQEYKKRHGEI